MKRVLIVDDQTSIKLFVKSILDGVGASLVVEFAADGYEAQELIKKQLPDLVITDIFMPRMDGIELIEYLKTLEPRPVIIAMTDSDISHDGTSLYLECAKLVGADYCLRKSDLVTNLAGVVKSCLTGKLGTQEACCK
ncbi:response regulator transcription factor [Litoribrevibacter euphylliae]|uniref:Response regulator transcription factor n=1 Tax=Litoribrevibacter euphylliae TaxID=1834034 RepID=A0ABV7H913_9GAMM